MAEFGVTATQLSAPQGAGATPIAPVQEQVSNTSMIGVIASVGDTFAQGIRQGMKAYAEQTRDNILGQFNKEMYSINEAIRTGMSASEAAARSQAVYGKYASAYPQFHDEITKSAAGFKGYTEVGTAVRKVETEADIRKSAMLSAQNDGYMFFPGMSTQAEDAQIQSHQLALRSAKDLDSFYKAQAEKRAQGTYDKGVAAEESKQTSLRLINDLASSNLNSSREFSVSVGQQVRNGEMSIDEARALITKRFASINLAIQSTAGINPELAAPYRSIFGEVQKLSEQLIDPKAPVEVLTAQIDSLLSRQKIMALQDPAVAKAISASQLFGNNAQVLLSNNKTVATAIERMLSTPADKTDISNPVVGNKGVEEPTFDFLRRSMSDVSSNKYNDNVKAKDEVNNVIRHTLKQTADMIGRGVDAKTLEEAVSFFASPEYGQWASTNTTKPEEQRAAYYAIQVIYQPTVVQGVEKRINEAFVTNTGLVPARAATGETITPKTAKLNKDNFSVQFNGSGIVFGMKNTPTDPLEARFAAQTLQSLKATQQALTQLVRAGAHMEGTTNYGKVWEENKHIFLPSFFSRYEGLEIGQTVNGMKYKGGDPKNPNSWGE